MLNLYIVYIISAASQKKNLQHCENFLGEIYLYNNFIFVI